MATFVVGKVLNPAFGLLVAVALRVANAGPRCADGTLITTYLLVLNDASHKFGGVVGSQCDENATLKYKAAEKAFGNGLLSAGCGMPHGELSCA